MNRRRIGSLTLMLAVTAGIVGAAAGPAAAVPSPAHTIHSAAAERQDAIGPYCWQVPVGWMGLCQPGLPWF